MFETYHDGLHWFPLEQAAGGMRSERESIAEADQERQIFLVAMRQTIVVELAALASQSNLIPELP